MKVWMVSITLASLNFILTSAMSNMHIRYPSFAPPNQNYGMIKYKPLASDDATSFQSVSNAKINKIADFLDFFSYVQPPDEDMIEKYAKNYASPDSTKFLNDVEYEIADDNRLIDLEEIFEAKNSSQHIEEYTASTEKRHKSIVVPCKCKSKFIHHDLGIDYFPRYFTSEICAQRDCLDGALCRETFYNVTVIRRRFRDEPDVHDTTLQKPPRSIRKAWVSKFYRLAVGCHCSFC